MPVCVCGTCAGPTLVAPLPRNHSLKFHSCRHMGHTRCPCCGSAQASELTRGGDAASQGRYVGRMLAKCCSDRGSGSDEQMTGAATTRALCRGESQLCERVRESSNIRAVVLQWMARRRVNGLCHVVLQWMARRRVNRLCHVVLQWMAGRRVNGLCHSSYREQNDSSAVR